MVICGDDDGPRLRLPRGRESNKEVSTCHRTLFKAHASSPRAAAAPSIRITRSVQYVRSLVSVKVAIMMIEEGEEVLSRRGELDVVMQKERERTDRRDETATGWQE